MSIFAWAVAQILNPPSYTDENGCYGKLNEDSEKILRRHVKGREVVDLGAGTMGLSKKLIELGASRVIAVDKDLGVKEAPHGAIRPWRGTFAQFESRTRSRQFQVAFLSWPWNVEMKGVVEILRRSDVVIYLGKNTDSTSCGWPALFDYLTHRRVLAEDSWETNTMLVYGPELKVSRRPRAEELAGMDFTKSYSFQAAEKAVKRAPWRRTRTPEKP